MPASGALGVLLLQPEGGVHRRRREPVRGGIAAPASRGQQ